MLSGGIYGHLGGLTMGLLCGTAFFGRVGLLENNNLPDKK